MDTRIVYFDESGDDGFPVYSSPQFILTGTCINIADWKDNYLRYKDFRNKMNNMFGLKPKVEMHTKQFLYDRSPYREMHWDFYTRQVILKYFIVAIASLNVSITNVIIDKTIIAKDNYDVLENALKYSIQRIENTSHNEWKYLIISDEGRINSMRKTARKMQIYNPIHSMSLDFGNKPITGLVEDVLAKESKESYFIQISDMVSYIVNLYYKTVITGEELPSRISNVIDSEFLIKAMNYLKENGVLNLSANRSNEYGLVIYPKKWNG